MLNLHIICSGPLREKYLREAAAEYEKRISAYAKLIIHEADTDEKMIKQLPQRGYKVALCVEGKQLSSEELAELIEKTSNRGISDIAFVIGAAEGLTEQVKAACDFRLSFSKMTFPHQLMRVILTEQLYRAMNINGNGNYHK